MNIGHWVTTPRDMGMAACTFTQELIIGKEVKRATVYASAMGVYTFVLNGKKVGKGVLAPGWTSYKHRVLYQTYDITDLLENSNKLEFGVGQGWAVGQVGYTHVRHLGAPTVSLTACIEIEYADGTTEEIITGEDWDVYTNHVTSSDIYSGETVDMTAPIECLGKAKTIELGARLEEQMGDKLA